MVADCGVRDLLAVGRRGNALCRVSRRHARRLGRPSGRNAIRLRGSPRRGARRTRPRGQPAVARSKLLRGQGSRTAVPPGAARATRFDRLRLGRPSLARRPRRRADAPARRERRQSARRRAFGDRRGEPARRLGQRHRPVDAGVCAAAADISPAERAQAAPGRATARARQHDPADGRRGQCARRPRGGRRQSRPGRIRAPQSDRLFVRSDGAKADRRARRRSIRPRAVAQLVWRRSSRKPDSRPTRWSLRRPRAASAGRSFPFRSTPTPPRSTKSSRIPSATSPPPIA